MSGSLHLGELYSVKLEDDGPDGISLWIEAENGTFSMDVRDDDVEKFDAALEPLREWHREFLRQKAAYGRATPEERDQVMGRAPDPFEENGYAPDDPKNPRFHDLFAEAADLARKARRERG